MQVDLAKLLEGWGWAAGLLLVSAVGCSGGGQWKAPPCPQCDAVVFPGPQSVKEPPQIESVEPEEPTIDDARQFMQSTERELKRLWIRAERAHWINYNFITSDTEELTTEAGEATMGFLSKAIKESTRFDKLSLPPVLARKFKLLRRAQTLPAPSDPKKTAELAGITSAMTALYGKGKYCPKEKGALRRELSRKKANKAALSCDPADPKGAGVSLGVLTKFLATSRNEEALREVWIGWRRISLPIRKKFKRYVELGNEGAREIGFSDVGELWRSGYDMSPKAFRRETERLWGQVKPFYEQLHCYVRQRLAKHYGAKLVKSDGPIPAHLLGNMWSQTWGNIYNLVEPYKGQGTPDVTAALKRKKYDEIKMVKLAEKFFTSVGLDPLPKTFWERSLFKKPADREVVCHASAWDVHYNNDLRIKMCIDRTEEELQVIHHELGHNYYYHYYYQLPVLFQQGANDGFHEAVGDAIALSITPGYLKEVGLINRVRNNEKADINFLMKMALDKVAFLPFGKLIDQWRWDVFAGKIKPHDYNKGWWRLRSRYQGIEPPIKRTDYNFDPGAKYHVPANVPYTRYFLAFIYQFQFQRALCRAAGHDGPLHKCSIYGNKAAGDKLKALLKMGTSKPWQEALKAMSGENQGDANALLAYFAPLRVWLANQVKGEKCGW